MGGLLGGNRGRWEVGWVGDRREAVSYTLALLYCFGEMELVPTSTGRGLYCPRPYLRTNDERSPVVLLRS